MNLRNAMLGALMILACGAGAASAAQVMPSEQALKDAGDQFDFGLWNQLLRKYVDRKGRVDYARLRGRAEDTAKLEKLYAQVGRQRLDALRDKNAKLAFLINAYNVCVWKNVLMRPTLKALDDKAKQTEFFDGTSFLVAGQEVSLNQLETREVRERFQDPRVHMALNCASGGCPQLPNEAFMPAKVQAQLDREVRKFCNEERNVKYDPASKTVHLSSIFDWYGQDFGGMPLVFINKHRTSGHQVPLEAKVQYVSYDWRLNDAQLPR